MRNTNKCCCLTSRTGATIIGLLGISLGSFAVIVFATGFGVKSSVFKAIQEKEDEAVVKVQEGEITEATSDNVIRFYENVQVFYPHILTTGLTFGLLYFMINLLMLLGVVKNNSWFILPWLVMTMICLISQTTGVLCYSIYEVLKGRVFDALIYFLMYCPFFLIGLYLWFIVYSVHSNMRKEAVIVYDLRPATGARNEVVIEEQPAKDDPPPPYKE